MSRPPHSSRSSSSTLARIRLECGLTQQQVADVARVHQVSISKAERGGRVSYPIAERIATALGRTVRDFWPTLERSVKRGRLLDTVIPFATAAKDPVMQERRRLRHAYSDPEGGQRVRHVHRPPLCCGAHWCRCVELDDPATYPIFGDPGLIEFEAGGVNG